MQVMGVACDEVFQDVFFQMHRRRWLWCFFGKGGTRGCLCDGFDRCSSLKMFAKEGAWIHG